MPEGNFAEGAAALLRSGDWARAYVAHADPKICERVDRFAALLLNLMVWRFQAALRGASWRLAINQRRSKVPVDGGATGHGRLPSIYGKTPWGARTPMGAGQANSQWKYVPVRRMALYLEQSLSEGLKWVAFEPDAEPLWAQIRLSVNGFMQNLFLQGALQGQTPGSAYFVMCDSSTTSQADVDSGIVNIVVGFAPLAPGEFVVLQVQQLAGQAAS